MSVQALYSTSRVPMNRLDMRGKLLWTLGNLLMLIGLYLLLYVGGLYADEQYNFLAAQRGSDISLPETITSSLDSTDQAFGVDTGADAVTDEQPAVAPLAGAETVAPAAASEGFTLPRLNSTGNGRELNSIVPSVVAEFGASTITGIIIPKIDLERKVIPVGMTVEVQNGQKVAVWEVAKYAVGHHKGTANPGQAGNIVLAGHSGGKAYPFNDIFYLGQGDPILLESNNSQLYEYSVTERLVLDEVGVPMAQRRENAQYIEPTSNEVVTLVTCWPLTGPNKFSQRVIVRAAPLHPATPAPDLASSQETPESIPVQPEPISGWTAR